jgi:hypothetical protein
MRKPNPLATVGAPISLMSNAAPKVAIMVASRCCVYILHSCMNKIIYSTHSTCHFSSSAAQNVATLSIYTYSICSKTNKHSGVKNIFYSHQFEPASAQVTSDTAFSGVDRVLEETVTRHHLWELADLAALASEMNLHVHVCRSAFPCMQRPRLATMSNHFLFFVRVLRSLEKRLSCLAFCKPFLFRFPVG